MKNTLTDLNNYLFEQLERLNDDSLDEEQLERELKKADTISRQAAIDILEGHLDDDYLDGYEYLNELKAIPSAQPQRMRGRWIPHKTKFGGEDEKVYTCDQCGHNIGFHAENFCPNCGADMRGEQDE